jgi:hypothetical protein
VIYPAVKRAHIVPKVYLRSFAKDGKIGMHLRGDVGVHVLSVDKVATRNRYYQRTRPETGERIDDVEWSLSELERKVSPVLRALVEDGQWPLLRDQKLKLATLFALQMLRGPRWQSWAETATRGANARSGSDRPIDTERLGLMLRLAQPLTTLLGSMQWLLVEFPAAVLATSDEPVVIWPLDLTSLSPADPQLFEFQHLLEVRVPVSPQLAIVMTWADAIDQTVIAKRDIAASLNAFTIGQADRQWFHLPGVVPATTAGALLPVSPRLVRSYGPESVATSRRRTEAARYALEGLNRPFGDKDVWMVLVEGSPAD